VCGNSVANRNAKPQLLLLLLQVSLQNCSSCTSLCSVSASQHSSSTAKQLAVVALLLLLLLLLVVLLFVGFVSRLLIRLDQLLLRCDIASSSAFNEHTSALLATAAGQLLTIQVH
jgi:hypothetical protein